MHVTEAFFARMDKLERAVKELEKKMAEQVQRITDLEKRIAQVPVDSAP